jgi:hypothetical protein
MSQLYCFHFFAFLFDLEVVAVFTPQPAGSDSWFYGTLIKKWRSNTDGSIAKQMVPSTLFFFSYIDLRAYTE